MIKRVFYSDNGVLTDIGTNLNNYHSGVYSFSYVAGEDSIYIGSQVPFNHLYFKLGAVPNAITCNFMFAYWDGKSFVNAIDVVDETQAIKQSGFVTWSTTKSKSWTRNDTNYGGSQITGLTSLDIYDLYWLKLDFSASLTASVELAWIGNKFAVDADLKDEHIDLTRPSFISAFETGKTDWEPQHIRAAELIIEDLIAKNLIRERGQILKREELKSAAIKRVAHLIYASMGKDYYDDRDKAKEEYDDRINKVIPSVDSNINGRYDYNEFAEVGRLIR